MERCRGSKWLSAAVILAMLAQASAASSGAALAARAAGAMDKVVEMLNNIVDKAAQEMQDEKVAYAKFSTWCSQEVAGLAKEISGEKQQVEEMSAETAKLSSDAKVLSDEVAKLQSKQAAYEADMKALTQEREQENKDFLESDKDLAESISALERAIVVLQEQNYDRTGNASDAGEALLQLSTEDSMPAKARSMIGAFLGMMEDPDFASYAAPEANAYEFQSTSIIDVLKRLLAEFKSKKGEGEKEEMKSVHAYKMAMQDLTDSVAEVKQSAEDKSAVLEEKSAKAASLKKQTVAVQNVLKEDQKMLSDTTTECDEKKLSFEEKQALRAEEQEAVKKAIEILSSEAASGNAAKYLSLMQGPSTGSALVQIQSTGQSTGLHRQISEFLEQEADRLHSKDIALLVEKIKADPFAKVRKLISNMIDRLMDEANADAEKEGFCDKEMGKSKVTRTRLQEQMDGLKASIAEGQATIAQLAQEIATLTEEVSEMDAAVKSATESRQEEKAKNVQTIEDATEAAAAVQQAMAVLSEFYKKAQTATAFIQEKASVSPPRMGSEEWKQLANPAFEGTVDRDHKEGMQTFGETYQGMQQEAGGVLALLEVIGSDFVKLKADTESAEAIAAEAHSKFLAECAQNKAVKAKAIEMDTTDKTAAEAKLQQDKADFRLVEDKFLAAERYQQEIEGQCVDKGMTFEERQAARQAEIASLKEALSLLSRKTL